MTDVLEKFQAKKNADSPFLTLQDGESARVNLVKEIKQVTKVGFSGDEVEVIRLICVVDTEFGPREKHFDNGSAKFTTELIDKGVKEGSSFVLTRDGEGPKTKYKITEVKNDSVLAAAVKAGMVITKPIDPNDDTGIPV